MGLRMAPLSTHFKISRFAVKIVSNIVHSERVTSFRSQILIAVLVTRVDKFGSENFSIDPRLRVITVK